MRKIAFSFSSLSFSFFPSSLILISAIKVFPQSYPPQLDTIEIHGRKVYFYIPPSYKGNNLLFLHGWGLSPLHYWENHTALWQFLDSSGTAIIIPDMGKSVYASRYFPETRADYQKQPTRTFLRDTVIPTIQQRLHLWKPSHTNLLMGISTGSRGAALLAPELTPKPNLVILLSGDYDQTLQPNDWLMINTYGPYSQFPERWKTIDNPAHRNLPWHFPTLIIHGANDKIVLVSQSKHFASILQKQNPNTPIQLYIDNQNHTEKAWRSYLPLIISFFEAHRDR